MRIIRDILVLCFLVSVGSGCGSDCDVTVENRLSLDITAVLFSPDTDDRWVWDNNLGQSAPIAVGESRDFVLSDVGISRWDFLALDSADSSYDSMDHQCVGGWVELSVDSSMLIAQQPTALTGVE